MVQQSVNVIKKFEFPRPSFVKSDVYIGQLLECVQLLLTSINAALVLDLNIVLGLGINGTCKSDGQKSMSIGEPAWHLN